MMFSVKFTMISLHRQTSLFLIYFELVACLKSQSVDPLHHVVLLRTFPIGTCKSIEGKAIFRNVARCFHMRTLAQVPEGPVAIEAESFIVCRKIFRLFNFIGLIIFAETLHHLRMLKFFTLKNLSGFNYVTHTLFQLRQVFRTQWFS